MNYKVEFTGRAFRQFGALPRDVQTRIRRAMEQVAANPRTAGGVRKLTGRKEYRVRVGDYRVVYEINDGAVVITVIAVAHRREVYR